MLEIFGVVTGLLYMALEIRQHRAMWIIGFITSLIYVFVFFFAKIYADMGLQIYYVFISVYGFWLWSRDRSKREERENDIIIYRHVSAPLLLKVTAVMAVFWFVIYYFLSSYTDSPIPKGDAFTTSVGIVATWMLAQRIIEHWYFWVLANTASIYIYYLRDLYPTMFLYFCYTIISILGLYIWLKKGVKTNDKTI